ncbi:MAG: TonB-dependent receptor plug domain-containing protein, partial [Calditrichaeota bacterium]|nr:TonB-dependent receptor plug domain-containing protein [Calditrichota bacterium]
MKFFYQLAIFVSVLISLAAQEKNLVIVKIVDEETKLSLPGAAVSIEGMNRYAVTDVNGSAVFVDIAAGNYTLKVTYLGFQDKDEEITVGNGQSNEFTLQLKSGYLEGEEIVVVAGRLRGQAKAFNQQKEANNVINVVSSDQVGRFPDANIGDAIKRIPGINVEYDQGEARFGLIRGTESRLNSVMINGDRVPSAEGETRAVQLDLIPSDMIQNIEVNKAITADMDADAIGGAVNLVTR